MRRWNEFGSPVGGESDFPVAVVDEPVMVAAEGDGVVQIGRAAIDPRLDVMHVRPPWRPITTRERAAAVAGEDGLAGGSGVGTAAAADVDRRPGTVEHDRQDPRRAGEP